jgi:hypothetical protein
LQPKDKFSIISESITIYLSQKIIGNLEIKGKKLSGVKFVKGKLHPITLEKNTKKEIKR